MSHRHAICLVVDGLRASALGCYGNTLYSTPQLDALASRALVADWLSADSPQLPDFYRSVWQGEHALRPESPDRRYPVLDYMRQAGVWQWLVTDEPRLMEQATHLPIDDALLFENDAEQVAARIEDTAFARYFTMVVQGLQQWRDDAGDDRSVAWLHCRGMYGPWDAPTALREELLDNDDPPAVEFVQPPVALRDVDDPDIVLTHRAAYAAQIAVLDTCVGAIVQAIEDVFADDDTLVMLVGSRGFALGEHGSIGTDCADMYGERLHLPWLLYPCGNSVPLPRQSTLWQPADVGATLLDWLGITNFPSDGISGLPHLGGGVTQERQLAVSVGERDEYSIRTAAWMLRKESTDAVQLFSKPDDRWEANDVVGLCPEIVDGLQRELARFQRCCQTGMSLPLTLEDDVLIESAR